MATRSDMELASQSMICASLLIKTIMESLLNSEYQYFFDKFNNLLGLVHMGLQYSLGTNRNELRQESIRCARRIDRIAESQGKVSNLEQEWTEWFDILYNSTEPM